MARRKTTKKLKLTKKRAYKKRVYKRKRTRNFAKVNNYPFGKSQVVKHNYLENFQMTTTLGVKSVYSFQINGMFDPNYTGAGHQPLGFDQLSVMYGRYNVIGARIKVKTWNRDADETMMVGLVINEQADMSAISPQTLIENGSMSYRIMPVVGSDFTNQQIHYLSANVSIKKFCKVDSVLDYDGLGSNPSTNPSRAVYAHIISWQPDGAASNAQISCYVELEQIAVWTRPVVLGQS